MKIPFRMFIVVSIVFFVVIVLKLLDTYTSLKYEVDEPRAMNKVGEALNDKEKYLKAFITWLWVSLCYVVVTIVIFVRALIGK
ncbi:hypothetical protein GA0116948_1326 [Chitinophaga costaii]|uniref:Uncharacterized protein n=1 Tax=Chitinophaga costaii TaxID=1335309 RepID=A0A1C4G8C8_9BACT|nr:hypothetical protein GA0116948_1326 [Chitinophaga costaii]